MKRSAVAMLFAVVATGAAPGCQRRESAPKAESARPHREALFVYVKIPAPIKPIERGERFEDPLDEALRKAGLGEVTGGGSQLSAPDAQGRRGIEYCGLDVDLYDPDRGLPFLRQELVRLRVPAGTVLQYTLAGKEQEVKVHAE